ncbi:MAG: hypothetical protein DHS20C05_17310 [Hyphococcus sp.]|nr:MAG: hypothetical protein DHS20C05_17310 [Marinicaulis sp.]
MPIPDLVGIGKNTTFGTAAPAPSLHAFIENAIIDEFQGAPPPAAIVAGLTFYVQQLKRADCPGGADAITLTRDTTRVREMLFLARVALKKDDASTADFLVLSAQNKLGHIHERFAGESLAEARADLISVSRNLAATRTALRNAPEAAGKNIDAVLPTLDALQESLAQQEVFSLYNKGQLAKAAGLAPEAPAP